MKYHHQKGIVEKNSGKNRKFWVASFLLFAVFIYCGLLYSALSFNGWPFSDVSASAKAVKTIKPGDKKLFIPKINIVAEKSMKIDGDPSYSDVTVTGPSYGFGITPSDIRQASLFFNIDMLEKGDQLFLDDQGVRYVYKVSSDIGDEDQKLIIKTDKKTIEAKSIGTIAWNNGKPALEAF